MNIINKVRRVGAARLSSCPPYTGRRGYQPFRVFKCLERWRRLENEIPSKYMCYKAELVLPPMNPGRGCIDPTAMSQSLP